MADAAAADGPRRNGDSRGSGGEPSAAAEERRGSCSERESPRPSTSGSGASGRQASARDSPLPSFRFEPSFIQTGSDAALAARLRQLAPAAENLRRLREANADVFRVRGPRAQAQAAVRPHAPSLGSHACRWTDPCAACGHARKPPSSLADRSPAPQAHRVDLAMAERWSTERAAELSLGAHELVQAVEAEALRQRRENRAEALRCKREAFLREERARAKRQGGFLLSFRRPPSGLLAEPGPGPPGVVWTVPATGTTECRSRAS